MNKINKKKLNNKNDNIIMGCVYADKLSVVVNVHDKKYFNKFYSHAKSWVENGEAGIVRVVPRGKYSFAILIYYPVNGFINFKGPHIRIELTSTKAFICQMRVEWNPGDLVDDSREYLDVMFTELMGMTFNEMLFHAKFTRADFCITISNRNIEDYLYRGKWTQCSQCMFGTDGLLGTLYLGKATGRQIKIYNKAKELYGKDAVQDSIRIEISLTKTSMGINELAKINNPFDNVEIYHIGTKNPPCEIGYLKAFQDSCRLRGISNALKIQPPEYRKKFKKFLSQYPVGWWNITNEDWYDLLLPNALEIAGLTDIPDSAPPLSLAFHEGTFIAA